MKKIFFFFFFILFAHSLTAAGDVLFYESFDDCQNDDEIYKGFTGGNDNEWSGNIATELVVFADNDDWTFDNVYGANQCIKLGSSGNLQGVAKTPAIAHNGDATLTFRVAPWAEDSTICVTVSVKGGTIEKGVFELKKKWNDISVNITDIEDNVTITFSTLLKKQRIFLDEIQLTAADPTAPAIRVSEGNSVDFGYVGRNYASLQQQIAVRGENLSNKGIQATLTDDMDGLFSVSPATLPANGGVLTITCKAGASADIHGAYLTLSAVGDDNTTAVSKTVSLMVEVSSPNLEGSGTKPDPYTINDRLLLAAHDGTVWSATYYWVTGYVLGAVQRKSETDQTFNGICQTDRTSLVLAATADETDMDRIVTVQISSYAREALNVVDNPELVGKKIKVQGILLTDKASPLYLGKPGVRDVVHTYQYEIPGQDDTPTAVDCIGLQADETWYDVLGRPVDENYKGIVVSRGKKHLRR